MITFLKTNPDTLIIINPKASSGKHENDRVFCNTLTNQLGDKLKLKSQRSLVILQDLLENILKYFEKILVIGGDGTINEVVNGFFEPSPKYITNSEESHDLIPISSPSSILHRAKRY